MNIMHIASGFFMVIFSEVGKSLVDSCRRAALNFDKNTAQEKKRWAAIAAQSENQLLEGFKLTDPEDARFLAEINWDAIDEQLFTWRMTIIGRKSLTLGVKDSYIRFYYHKDRQNIQLDVYDVFARSIDSLRAYLYIQRHHNERGADRQLAVRQSIQSLCHHLVRLNTLCKEDIATAVQMGRSFNRELLQASEKNGIFSGRDQAKKVLDVLRDTLYRMSFTQNMISFSQRYSNERAFAFSYFEPFLIPRDHASEAVWGAVFSEPTDSNSINHPVIAGLFGKVPQLMQLCLPPMQRFLPNAANTFWCSTVLAGRSGILYQTLELRTAITEPYDIPSLPLRKTVHQWNINALLLSEEFGTIFQAIERECRTPILLHQTLIGDEVAFSPDCVKTAGLWGKHSVISVKNELMNALAERPASAVVSTLYDKTINILSVNTCVNMWHHRSRIRQEDRLTPRLIIANAYTMLERELGGLEHSERALSFLQQDHKTWFYDDCIPDSGVLASRQEILAILLGEDPPTIDYPSFHARYRLALLLCSAMSLKAVVHESAFTALMRDLREKARLSLRPIAYFGVVLNIGAQLLLSLFYVLMLPVYCIVNLSAMIRHFCDRKTVYKAAYEALATETMGIVVGGCMSSLDRATEIASIKDAMRWQLFNERTMLDYHDDRATKLRFFKTYGQTTTKHDFVDNATGIPGTSDRETIGLGLGVHLMSYQAETALERAKSSMSVSLRKGSY